MERDEVGARKVDPYHLLFQGGQFYLLGHSHERDAIRVFRLSRIRGKVAYATKAEHDFKRPTGLRPARLRHARRLAVRRAESATPRSDLRAHRLAGRAPLRPLRRACARRRRRRDRLHHRLRQRAPARRLGAAARRARARPRARRAGRRARRARRAARRAPRRRARAGAGRPARRAAAEARGADAEPTRQRETAIRPERFARLVTLASILIEAGRARTGCRRRRGLRARCRSPTPSCARTSTSSTSSTSAAAPTSSTRRSRDDGHDRGRPRAVLRQLRPPGAAAAGRGEGADRRDRPDRRPPARGRAGLGAREDRRRARRGPDRAGPAGRSTAGRRLARSPASSRARSPSAGCCASSTTRPTRTSSSERIVEPYALINGREGWYVASFDPAKDDVRHFRLDRDQDAPRSSDERFTPRPEVDPAADVDGWPRTGEVEASRVARVWISPERARWAREERRVDAGAGRRLGDRRAALTRASTGSCARCWPRPATPPCWSRRRRARRCAPRSSGCSRPCASGPWRAPARRRAGSGSGGRRPRGRPSPRRDGLAPAARRRTPARLHRRADGGAAGVPLGEPLGARGDDEVVGGARRALADLGAGRSRSSQ